MWKIGCCCRDCEVLTWCDSGLVDPHLATRFVCVTLPPSGVLPFRFCQIELSESPPLPPPSMISPVTGRMQLHSCRSSAAVME